MIKSAKKKMKKDEALMNTKKYNKAISIILC